MRDHAVDRLRDDYHEVQRDSQRESAAVADGGRVVVMVVAVAVRVAPMFVVIVVIIVVVIVIVVVRVTVAVAVATRMACSMRIPATGLLAATLSPRQPARLFVLQPRRRVFVLALLGRVVASALVVHHACS
jgi:hypothetical protein